MKKYDIITSSKIAIYNYSDYGPYFGNYEIYFGKDLQKGNSYAFENDNAFLESGKLELTGGIGEKETFDTVEIEVFKIF